MKKLLNKLNGWQRVYLILSVVWTSIVCFTEIVLEEQIDDFWRIEKPSLRLMDDAGLMYTECVRKQTYEQYVATYKEEFEVYLSSYKPEKKQWVDGGINFNAEDFFGPSFPESYLPEYKTMEKFLDSKAEPVSKGLTLDIPYWKAVEGYYSIRAYKLMREHFPEFSEEFDGIDRTLKEKYRYKVVYVKELAQNYLLSPLKIFAVVILPIIGVYWLLLAMISLTRWVLAGFSS